MKLEEEIKRIDPRCYGWALRCCYENETAAAEVLKNTYLKVLEGKARYRERSALKTWLFSVIRNTAGGVCSLLMLLFLLMEYPKVAHFSWG